MSPKNMSPKKMSPKKKRRIVTKKSLFELVKLWEKCINNKDKKRNPKNKKMHFGDRRINFEFVSGVSPKFSFV